MDSMFDSGSLPDIQNIRKWLGRDIPWNLMEQWEKTRNSNSDWLNNYMKELLVNSKKSPRVQSKSWGEVETRKDSKHVTLSIELDPDVDRRRLRIFATSNRIKLTGLPDDDSQSVRLPCLVYAKTGKVTMKNDRLIIRFNRRPSDTDEHELFIE